MAESLEQRLARLKGGQATQQVEPLEQRLARLREQSPNPADFAPAGERPDFSMMTDAANRPQPASSTEVPVKFDRPRTATMSNAAEPARQDVIGPQPPTRGVDWLTSAGVSAHAAGESWLRALYNLAKAGSSAVNPMAQSMPDADVIMPQKAQAIAGALKPYQSVDQNLAGGIMGAAPYFFPGFGQALFAGDLGQSAADRPGAVVDMAKDIGGSVANAAALASALKYPVLGQAPETQERIEQIRQHPLENLMNIALPAGIVAHGATKLTPAYRSLKTLANPGEPPVVLMVRKSPVKGGRVIPEVKKPDWTAVGKDYPEKTVTVDSGTKREAVKGGNVPTEYPYKSAVKGGRVVGKLERAGVVKPSEGKTKFQEKVDQAMAMDMTMAEALAAVNRGETIPDAIAKRYKIGGAKTFSVKEKLAQKGADNALRKGKEEVAGKAEVAPKAEVAQIKQSKPVPKEASVRELRDKYDEVQKTIDALDESIDIGNPKYDKLIELRNSYAHKELDVVYNKLKNALVSKGINEDAAHKIITTVYEIEPGNILSPQRYYELMRDMKKNPEKTRESLREALFNLMYVSSDIQGSHKPSLEIIDQMGPFTKPMKDNIKSLVSGIDNEATKIFTDIETEVAKEPVKLISHNPKDAIRTDLLKSQPVTSKPVVKKRSSEIAPEAIISEQKKVETAKQAVPSGPELGALGTPESFKALGETAKKLVTPKPTEPPFDVAAQTRGLMGGEQKPPPKVTKPKPPKAPEGETKPSRLAVRAEEDAIEKNLVAALGELPEYKTMNMADQAQRAKSLMDTDYGYAKNVAMGKAEPPTGLRPASVYEAVKIRALKDGDVSLLRKLATESEVPTRLSELGQEIKAADSRLQDDPVRAMQDVVKSRQERATKTGRDKAVSNEEIDRLQTELDQTKKALDEALRKNAVHRRGPKYGSKNKIVTTDAYNKALTELRNFASGAQLNMGLDPKIVANLGRVGTYHFEAGTRAFADWSVRMVEDTGEWVKPYLAETWTKIGEEGRQKRGLKANKTRLTNLIKQYEERLKTLDFDKRQRRAIAFDKEATALREKYLQAKKNYDSAAESFKGITKSEAETIVNLAREMEQKRAAIDAGGDRLEYGAAKVVYNNFVNRLKGEGAPVSEVLKDRVREFKVTWGENPSRAVFEVGRDAVNVIMENSISLVATLDNSFIGRQGIKTLKTHPTVWAHGAWNSFIDFAKGIGGKNAHDALMADVYSRENYLNGNYQKAKLIPLHEEQFPTSLPGKIPIAGRVFKGSEYAFTGAGIRMRTRLFDMLYDRMIDSGVKPTDNVQIQALGKMINSLTARGQWGKKGEPAVVRLVMWAPKMLKGNLDVLTAHNLGTGLESGFARRQAALNLVKIVGTDAAIIMIANALKPGSAETDPRSSDFGKVKIGNTRFDFTGGAGSLVVLGARIATRQTKNPATGQIKSYGIKYGDSSPFDALTQFLVNKTTPSTRVLVDWLRGYSYGYKPFSVGRSAFQAFTPITIQQAVQLKDNASADQVASVILDGFGISSYTIEKTQSGRTGPPQPPSVPSGPTPPGY